MEALNIDLVSGRYEFEIKRIGYSITINKEDNEEVIDVIRNNLMRGTFSFDCY